MKYNFTMKKLVNIAFLLLFSVALNAQYAPFQIAFAVWQDPANPSVQSHYPEAVAPVAPLSGGPGTVWEGSLGSPTSWYQVVPEEHVDFSRANAFNRIGVVLFNPNPFCIPMGHDWSPTGCPELAPDFFPMTARVTVTARATNGTTTSVFDQVITWEWPNNNWYGGYGFYWWHRTISGYNIPNYGGMPSDNWVSPNNYYNGEFFMRFEIISQPTSDGGVDPPPPTVTVPSYTIDYGNERTGAVVPSSDQYSYDNVNFITGTNAYVSLTPGQTAYFRRVADYSKKQTLTVPGRPAAPTFSIDYTNERTSAVVSSQYRFSSNSNMSGAQVGTGAFVPLVPGSTLYFQQLASSSTFKSSIQQVIAPSRPVVPTFGIDYASERTSSTVTDEYIYSSNSDMSSSSTGDGSHVSLTPGSNKYFRKKATGSAFASDKQSLSVPGRPAAPSFGIDYPNERTSTPVSSEYQYSSNSDMSSATTGNGSYVSLAPGSTTYFRKLGTASAFASNIQELIIQQVSPPNYSINYSNEQTNKVVSTNDQYSYSSDFSTVLDGNGQYLSLTPGTNIYFRVKSDPSKKQTLTVPGRPLAPSFGINYLNERTSTTVNSEYKFSSNSDMSSSSTGNGTYVSLTPGSNKYFRRLATGSAFASNIQELVVPTRPSAPNFDIDYSNERTSTTVSSEYKYSTNNNMSSSFNGNGSYVSLTPGINLFFRRSAGGSSFASPIQELIVPGRPITPSFGIDYVNERTSTTVSSEYQHSVNSDMSSASIGNGSQLNLTPGSNKYFRKLGSASVFASTIQELIVPSRPGAPSFGIDYVNERTSTIVESSHVYSTLSDMSDAVSGTGEYLELSPGNIRYFRRKATSSAFLSNVQTLAAPSRPAAPSFEIDYIKEEISTIIITGYLYGYDPILSDATQGTGNVLQVTPGVTIYFQALASSSVFASDIQTVVSQDRPAAPVIGINFINETTDRSVSSEIQYSGSSGFETAENGTGLALNILPGKDLFFRFKAAESSFSSEILRLPVPGRPIISSSESGSTTLYPFITDITFLQDVASLENNNLTIVNAELKDLSLQSSGASETVYEGQVYAAANDIITISVPANAVNEGNFASNTFTVSFTGQLSGVGNELFDQNSFTVFPNPGKDVFHIRFKNFKAHTSYMIECCSITGEVVHTETLYWMEDLRLDLSDLPDGFYVLRLFENDKVAGVVKLIIK